MSTQTVPSPSWKKEPTIPWSQPGWLEEAQSWLRKILEKHSLFLTGPIDQPHIRPWSTVLRVPTHTGLCYFKACSPLLGYEPALTGFLADLRPDLSPDLLEIDLSRGWMLMRDSGVPLRTYIRSEKSLARWQEILPVFTNLQQQMIPHAAQILALGVLDRRLEQLPRKFELLVANQAAMLIDQPESLTQAEYTRLQTAGADFERLCAELASFSIPASLHHDDFHDGNLFLQGSRVIFSDWGESALAHPFFSLVVLLRGASNSLDLQPDAPELDQLREWYLNGWSNFLPPAELRRAARLAERIGLVNRALTWHHILDNLPAEIQPEYALAVPSYLQEYINTP